jgi:probable rRNA maturation factor
MNVVALKDSILGKRYDLSVAFLSAREMRAVTRKTKNKNKASNVLAFPLSKSSGEILICKETANKQNKAYGMSQRDFITFLLIHGMLHLKGHRHGATMENEERRVLRRLGVRVRNE